ncbi:hypothetical protein NJB1907f44_48080 [Mycobacterium marinum]|nr:hypothetical protein NJB1808e29_09530 [Mycobacterium marinum]GJO03620.1 hypothetical protein NJB1907E90_10640 [Mycobacterium marinum]GJO04280.1 hypothetical protein NJB1907f34b_25580 [Mycobacterium marinum]GJO13010.1 hypothetical protein NJB1907E11_07340 [Mycobacterium marinum]GJO18110.1 hypothetical protein NJB1728e18_14370 [Mycobacterium marinum]
MLVAASAEHDGNPETFATPAAATHNLERLPGAERPGRTTRLPGQSGGADRTGLTYSGLVLRPSNSAIASSTDRPL